MSLFIHSIPTPAKTLSTREQSALLKTSGERKDGFRDHMLFAIALGTGLREHEIVALNVGDVASDDGSIRRRVSLRVFKRSSKSPAPQDVVLPEALRMKLSKYLRWKEQRGERLTPDAPLFLSQKHNRLSTRQVRTLFVNWQKRAGIEKTYNFHAIRHAACTNLYRATKDIRITQRFARHKSILTTARYSHPSEDELVRAVQHLPC